MLDFFRIHSFVYNVKTSKNFRLLISTIKGWFGWNSPERLHPATPPRCWGYNTTMPVLRPRPLPPALLFCLVPIASWRLVRPLLEPFPAIPALYASIDFSLFAFLATVSRASTWACFRQSGAGRGWSTEGIRQCDYKGGETHVNQRYQVPWNFNNLIYWPESLGLVAASIYILSWFCLFPSPSRSQS